MMESGVYNLIKIDDGKVAGNAIGRTGNQMFATVAAMTYAKRTSREFVGMLKAGAPEQYPEEIEKTIMRNVKYVPLEELDGFYYEDTGPWLCNGFPNTDIKNILLNDYFQDARCIDRDIAYYLFKPYDSILKTIYELYPDINDMVCVHVRRGDYLELDNRGFNHYSKEELDEIIQTHFPGDKILFISDDIQWCKDNFSGDKYYFADKPYENPVEIDLYLQTQCKGNIISNSSFSWWGAYLNERTEKVVCHWPWFKPGIIHPMETLLPENWIKYEFKPNNVEKVTNEDEKVVEQEENVTNPDEKVTEQVEKGEVEKKKQVVDIVCIAKREEMTIVDWVEYHRQIGINHIYIFDNNDVGDLSLVNKLKIYIDCGFVTVFDNIRGMKGMQMECYNAFVRQNLKERVNDWTLFIDCDEYLSLRDKYNNISDFLNDIESNCPNIGVLYVNWDCYWANGKIFYDPRPVVERFNEKLQLYLEENSQIKAFVKTGCQAFYQGNPHNPIPIDGKKTYDTLFRLVNLSPFQEIRDDYPVYINHYLTKSLQEYLYRKYQRETADNIGQNPYDFKYFIKRNGNDEYYEKAFNMLIELMNDERN